MHPPLVDSSVIRCEAKGVNNTKQRHDIRPMALLGVCWSRNFEVSSQQQKSKPCALILFVFVCWGTKKGKPQEIKQGSPKFTGVEGKMLKILQGIPCKRTSSQEIHHKYKTMQKMREHEGLVAQCSATPASVAATPPCSATPFQRQLDVWPFKGDRRDRAFWGVVARYCCYTWKTPGFWGNLLRHV